MSQKSYEVFQSVENKAIVLASYWNNFKTEIVQHLPESYHAEIDELSGKLEGALETLIHELRHPTLILATTGTTSSGKSTLVNFLCGADIVPTAVSEMSAGAVTIEYSQEKGLVIEETPGALWECGWWRDISDEEICKRLEQAMIGYIDNKKDKANLAYPKFIIYYPFRLFKEYEQDLPRGVKVKILDLPGLSYVGDESNMEVIKQCREALCLVTYNSQETDPQKVKSLLLQVVEEVKGLGGSPERMLFILNKIDVFRDDKDWVESERRFVEKTTTSIKHELREQLREYTQAIDNLKIIKLSTRPALLSLQIRDNNQDDSNLACENADHECSKLIEKTILEDLPRKAENWSNQDKIRVADDLWNKSYAEEFQEYLNGHISQHFPKLVIPQAIDKFNVSAGNTIAQWAIQTTTAILNSSEDNYQAECQKMLEIQSSLNLFHQLSNTNLQKPLEDINNNYEEYLCQSNSGKSKDSSNILVQLFEELGQTQPYNEIKEKLIPLYDWREALNRGVDQILESVAESLDNGRLNLNAPNFKKVQILQVASLESCLTRLIRLGYSHSIAKEGETRVAKTQEEKNKLKELNIALNELSINLSLVMAQVLDKISMQEINRMHEAVSELFKCHLSYLEKGSNEIAPDIFIKFPKSELNLINTEFKFNFVKFESDFAIVSQQYTQEYRSWKHWLWIVPKKEKYLSDNATIPSTEKILDEWKEQLKRVEPDMIKQVVEWLLIQVNELKKNVDAVQDQILYSYREKLEKARQEITLDYEKQKNVWGPMQQGARRLAQEFTQLDTFMKKENSLSDE